MRLPYTLCDLGLPSIVNQMALRKIVWGSVHEAMGGGLMRALFLVLLLFPFVLTWELPLFAETNLALAEQVTTQTIGAFSSVPVQEIRLFGTGTVYAGSSQEAPLRRQSTRRTRAPFG